MILIHLNFSLGYASIVLTLPQKGIIRIPQGHLKIIPVVLSRSDKGHLTQLRGIIGKILPLASNTQRQAPLFASFGYTNTVLDMNKLTFKNVQ